MVGGDANPNIVVAMQIQLQKLQQQNEALQASVNMIQQQQDELHHNDEETEELDP